MGIGDRREQRRWQRELERQLEALPTYDGDAPDGGPVAPVGRLPRARRPSRRERRELQRAAAARVAHEGGRMPVVRNERRRTVMTVGITLAVILAVLGMSPLAQPIRAFIGWEDRGEGSAYAFLDEDPLTGRPTTWKSCEPIRFEVNTEGAPDGWEDTLDDAIEEVADATGLEMSISGTTNRRPDFDDQPGAFGGADPVLVAWATPEEEPELAGDTVGVAGPRQRGRFYVTGTVVFDTVQFGEIERSGGERLQRAIMMHELAHLVGLGHVNDERQLMYPTTTFQTDFGNGDLEGLRRLGEGGC